MDVACQGTKKINLLTAHVYYNIFILKNMNIHANDEYIRL